MHRRLRSGLSLLGVCLAIALVRPIFALPQSFERVAIRELLDAQAAAWNKGDLEGFMSGYWKSDETVFMGSSGIIRGWQAVLDRYRRSYPDRRTMGRLTFTDIEIHQLSDDASYIIGRYQLEREKDHPEGVFTLIARKFPDGWRIALDHTSAFVPADSQKRE
jgi:uncharacterized protein (TIGR02246 family)